MENATGTEMRLDSIQALRGLAAYLVLIYHVRSLEGLSIKEMGSSESELVGGIFLNGYAGVDLFFVISGFIMVYVTASRPESLTTIKDFLLARIFRIFPPWWLFAGLMMTYLFVTYGVAWDSEALAATDISGSEHIFRSLFLLPSQIFLSLVWAGRSSMKCTSTSFSPCCFLRRESSCRPGYCSGL